jgi:hypothetical protein
MTYQDLLETKRYPAILRGSDNKILSTGEVLVRASANYGVFWPKDGAALNIPPNSQAIVETHQDVRIVASKFVRCPDPGEVHYEFDIEPLA